MRTPPLLADFTHIRVCKPFCENSLTLPKNKKSIRKGKIIRRIYTAVNKKRALLPKRGALQVVKTEIRLWYFCGQTGKSPQFSLRRFPVLVDGKGIEPSTSAMRKVI